MKTVLETKESEALILTVAKEIKKEDNLNDEEKDKQLEKNIICTLQTATLNNK